MAIILPKQRSFGESLLQGLGSGLEALAQQKLQQIKQRNLAQQLQQGYGFKPEEAQAFSQLPPELQQQAFKEKLAAPGKQANLSILNQLQGGGQPINIPEGAGITNKEALDLAKFGQKERQIEALERKETRQYLKPFAEAASKRAATIQSNAELKEIALSGNLRAGNLQQILSSVGWGQFNQPLENEVAQKNLDAQATNAASAYGTSRLNIFAEKTYKNSLGTLWNTPQGLYTVANINNIRAKAENAIDKARTDIIRENKGIVPGDIETLARERAQPQLDKYANKEMAVVTGAAEKYLKAQHKRFQKKENLKGFNTPKEILKAGYKPGQRFRLDDGSIGIWNGREVVPESEYKG